MDIIVDRAKCTGTGLCEAVAPAVFEVNDDGELIVTMTTVPDGELEAVRQAVDGCPTEALRLAE